MHTLHHSFLAFSLVTLLLGCSQDNNSDAPLVPEITSIEIEDANVTTAVHAINVDEDQKQFQAIITYSDGSSDTTANELNWESNDSTIITVNNGLITVLANHGSVALSASYRDKLYTTTDKIITIIPVTDVNITSDDINISYAVDGNASVDLNTSQTGSYNLLANITFEDNQTIKALTTNRVWRSSNVTVASVDSTGQFTLNAIDHNATADINVSVYNEVNTSLELNVTQP